MKQILRLFSLLFVLILTSEYALPAQVATARIMESDDAKASRILMVFEDGTSETIPLAPFRGFEGNAPASKAMTENQQTISAFLNKRLEEGYLISDIDTEINGWRMYSFIVFEKIKPGLD